MQIKKEDRSTRRGSFF